MSWGRIPPRGEVDLITYWTFYNAPPNFRPPPQGLSSKGDSSPDYAASRHVKASHDHNRTPFLRILASRRGVDAPF
jgi:hypothetical protein